MNKRFIIRIGAFIGILAVGFFGMTALGSAEKESNKRELEPEIRTVETQTVTYGDIALEVHGNGVVESQRTLKIISEVTGQLVFAKNNLKDGTFTKEGEVIARVDDREVLNNLFSMRSDFINTVASVLPDLKIENTDIYKKWLDYFYSLDIKTTIPDLPQITDSQEKIKISTRNVFTKYYNVKNQEIYLSRHTITAPFDGYVKSNGLIVGVFISKGQELFTLNDAKNLEIAIPLLVDEVNFINFSNPPRVKINSESGSDRSLTGHIYRKQNLIDKNSQSLNVYVTFINSNLDPYFLPGNYVTVTIEGKLMRNCASIPRYVVDNENYVFTMEDGKLAKRKIDLAAFQGDNVIIHKSLPEKTEIVTTILQKPLIGMRIQSVNGINDSEEPAGNQDKYESLTHN